MNRYNKISASFTLKTSDLPLTIGSNSIGSLENTYRSSMIWSNVDIESILGEMWEKYTYFRIILVSSLASSTTASHSPDTIVVVKLQGLQFVNSGYSIKSKATSSAVQVGIVTFNTNYGSSFQNKDVAFVMFKKGRGVVDLAITLNSTISDKLGTAFLFQNPEGNVIFPHTCYTFRIEGVD